MPQHHALLRSLTIAALSCASLEARQITELTRLWSHDIAGDGVVMSLEVDGSGRTIAAIRPSNTGPRDGQVLCLGPLGEAQWSTDLPDVFSLRAALHPNGEITIGATTDSALVPGALGGKDVWLIRLDPDGQELWQKRVGGSGDNTLAELASYGDGFYIAGETEADGYAGASTPCGLGAPRCTYVARYDRVGNEVWAHTDGTVGSYYDVSAIAVSPSGRVTFGGIMTTPGHSPRNFQFVYRSDGLPLAATSFTGYGIKYLAFPADDWTLSVAHDPDIESFVRRPAATLGAHDWIQSWSRGAYFTASFGASALGDDQLLGSVYGFPFDGVSPRYAELVRADPSGTVLERYELPVENDIAQVPGIPAFGPDGQLVVYGDRFHVFGSSHPPEKSIVRVSPLAQFHTTTCDGVPNSTTLAAALTTEGSPYRSDNRVKLIASQLPAGVAVMFIVGTEMDLVVRPGSSQGNLCIGGTLGRFSSTGSVGISNSLGMASLQVNLDLIPNPTGSTSATAGQDLHFQAWYRDVNPGPTSNFTTAVSVELL